MKERGRCVNTERREYKPSVDVRAGGGRAVWSGRVEVMRRRDERVGEGNGRRRHRSYGGGSSGIVCAATADDEAGVSQESSSENGETEAEKELKWVGETEAASDSPVAAATAVATNGNGTYAGDSLVDEEVDEEEEEELSVDYLKVRSYLNLICGKTSTYAADARPRVWGGKILFKYKYIHTHI